MYKGSVLYEAGGFVKEGKKFILSNIHYTHSAQEKVSLINICIDSKCYFRLCPLSQFIKIIFWQLVLLKTCWF